MRVASVRGFLGSLVDWSIAIAAGFGLGFVALQMAGLPMAAAVIAGPFVVMAYFTVVGSGRGLGGLVMGVRVVDVAGRPRPDRGRAAAGSLLRTVTGLALLAAAVYIVAAMNPTRVCACPDSRGPAASASPPPPSGWPLALWAVVPLVVPAGERFLAGLRRDGRAPWDLIGGTRATRAGSTRSPQKTGVWHLQP